MNYIAEWLYGYRRFWELRMERIEEYLRKLQEKDKQASQGKPANQVKAENDDSKR